MRLDGALPAASPLGRELSGLPTAPVMPFADYVAERGLSVADRDSPPVAFRFEELGVFGIVHALTSGGQSDGVDPAVISARAAEPAVAIREDAGVSERENQRDFRRMGTASIGPRPSAPPCVGASPPAHQSQSAPHLIDAPGFDLGVTREDATLPAEGSERLGSAGEAAIRSRRQNSTAEPQISLIAHQTESGVSVAVGGAGLSSEAQAELVRRLQATALALGFSVDHVLIDGLAQSHFPAELQPERTVPWLSIR